MNIDLDQVWNGFRYETGVHNHVVTGQSDPHAVTAASMFVR